MNVFLNIPKKLVLLLIKTYQKTLSFDHSFWARPEIYRVCLHYPSCSQYSYEAIEKFGVVKGSLLGFFRILRCNPFNKHRNDPVPDKFRFRVIIFGSNSTKENEE